MLLFCHVQSMGAYSSNFLIFFWSSAQCHYSNHIWREDKDKWSTLTGTFTPVSSNYRAGKYRKDNWEQKQCKRQQRTDSSAIYHRQRAAREALRHTPPVLPDSNCGLQQLMWKWQACQSLIINVNSVSDFDGRPELNQLSCWAAFCEQAARVRITQLCNSLISLEFLRIRQTSRSCRYPGETVHSRRVSHAWNRELMSSCRTWCVISQKLRAQKQN